MKRNWYKFRVKYSKEMDDGKKKKVSEEYLVDAESFTRPKNVPTRLRQTLSAHGTLTSPLFPVNLCQTSSRARSRTITIGIRPSWHLSPWMKRRGRRSSRPRSCTSMPRTPRRPMNCFVTTWRAVRWIGKSSLSQRPRCWECWNTSKP